MKCALAGVLALAVVVLSVMAFGCASSGDTGGGGGVVIPEMPPELMTMLLESVGTTDGEGGFRSPTDEPGMESVHAACIAGAALVAGQSPQIKAFAETTTGATALLLLANKAGCPISKGVLIAGGWSLILVGKTEQGYRIFAARHRDGREIGFTAMADTAESAEACRPGRGAETTKSNADGVAPPVTPAEAEAAEVDGEPGGEAR